MLIFNSGSAAMDEPTEDHQYELYEQARPSSKESSSEDNDLYINVAG
jgi:hypothetical protein